MPAVEEKNKNKIDISVCGTPVTIVSDEDPEYVSELGSRLDKRVSDLMLKHGRCSKTEALILCAIEALDAAIKLKNKLENAKGSADNE